MYPLKLVDDLRLGFTLEGYPLEIPGRDMLARIHRHAGADDASRIRTPRSRCAQIAFAPIDEPALVMLLDIDSTLPLTRERVVPATPAADVAGGPADRQRRLERSRTPV